MSSSSLYILPDPSLTVSEHLSVGTWLDTACWVRRTKAFCLAAASAERASLSSFSAISPLEENKTLVLSLTRSCLLSALWTLLSSKTLKDSRLVEYSYMGFLLWLAFFTLSSSAFRSLISWRKYDTLTCQKLIVAHLPTKSNQLVSFSFHHFTQEYIKLVAIHSNAKQNVTEWIKRHVKAQ